MLNTVFRCSYLTVCDIMPHRYAISIELCAHLYAFNCRIYKELKTV